MFAGRMVLVLAVYEEVVQEEYITAVASQMDGFLMMKIIFLFALLIPW